MKLLPLSILVATIAIVVAVGGAFATGRGTQASGSAPGTPVTGVSDPAAHAPVRADGPYRQPEPAANARSAETRLRIEIQAASDRGACERGSGAADGHLSTSIILDDGGDCGQRD